MVVLLRKLGWSWATRSPEALWNYRLHPELLAPAPAMSLRSLLHPNHIWQIDASRCVLFYLPRASRGDNGLRIMDYTDFYQNKPAYIINVINERCGATW